MKKRKLTKIGKLLLYLVCVLLLAVVLIITKPWTLIQSNPPKATPVPTVEPTLTPTAEPTPESTMGTTPEFDYATSKATNPDYVGELRFENDLVHEQVVQSYDNEKYLQLTWDLQYSTQGAAFLDYRNSLNDQNMILYGHFIYYDESKMFSPLHLLKEQANYEDNKYIDFFLDGSSRRYLVTDVYYYEMNNDNMMYFYTNYDPTYFETYMSTVKQVEFYDTGETLTMEDHWLTLQTCVRDREDRRLIVLAKDITEE